MNEDIKSEDREIQNLKGNLDDLEQLYQRSLRNEERLCTGKQNTDEEQVSLCLDYQKFNNKPRDEEIPYICARIASEKVELPLNEFKKAIVMPNGQTFTPATFCSDEEGRFNRENQFWEAQQIFCLDFDAKPPIAFEEVIKRCEEYDIIPILAYSTFSSENNDRFRVIFMNEFKVTDIRIREVIQLALKEIFPGIDKNSLDPAHLFFGGKEIIYENLSSRICPDILIQSMCRWMKEKDAHNFSRGIKRFCCETGMALRNGVPVIDCVEIKDCHTNLDGGGGGGDNNNLSKTGNFLSNISGDSTNSSTFLVERDGIMWQISLVFSNGSDRKASGKPASFKSKRKTIEGFDWEKLSTKCPLYREFTSGIRLRHSERFLLATNFIQIKGGRKRFMECSSLCGDYNHKKWKYDLDYMVKQLYKPMLCNRNCPYYDTCANNEGTLLDAAIVPRGKIKVINPPELILLNEAEDKLWQAFNRALAAQDDKIYAIQGNAGLGKSECYLRLKNVLIAVPTHQLKNEIAERMESVGNKPLQSPELPDFGSPHNEIIEQFFKVGDHIKAKIYISETLAPHNEEARKYLRTLDNLRRSKKTVITTHERLAFTNYQHSTIIIDEDIFETLLHQGMMKVTDFKRLCNLAKKRLVKYTPKEIGILGEIDVLLDLVEKAKYDRVYESPRISASASNEVVKSFNSFSGIGSNVLGFLSARIFVKVKSETEDEIHFINQRFLPFGKKIIILTATANEKIYRRLFGNRLDFTDIGPVQQVGSIIQYPENSNSRWKFEDKKDYRHAQKIAGNKPVITYKEYQKLFFNPVGHFGGLRGLNAFSGQDLVIVGTPNIPKANYLLLAKALGIQIKKRDTAMSYMPVRWNGFEFWFQTFKNPELREIQFYKVESELIQAVSRARTIRHDCTVTVLSNFPVLGAEFVDNKRKEKDESSLFEEKEELVAVLS
jgi:hypothetical protein